MAVVDAGSLSYLGRHSIAWRWVLIFGGPYVLLMFAEGALWEEWPPGVCLFVFFLAGLLGLNPLLAKQLVGHAFSRGFRIFLAGRWVPTYSMLLRMSWLVTWQSYVGFVAMLAVGLLLSALLSPLADSKESLAVWALAVGMAASLGTLSLALVPSIVDALLQKQFTGFRLQVEERNECRR